MNQNMRTPTILRNILSKYPLIITLLLLILFPVISRAQLECIIESNANMPVCNGQLVQLSVAANDNYTYLWSPGGETTASIDITAIENKEFRVTVTDTISGEECLSAPYLLEVRPRIESDLQQMQLTCTNGDNDNGNTAMVQASASGESTTFDYRWDVRPVQIAPGNPALAIGLKAHLWYFITIEDEFGCLQKDSIFTQAYANPLVEIEADPDTAYIQNPYINFSFTNLSADSIDITNHFWEFGDESPSSDLDTPEHLYTEEGDYNIVLTVVNPQGCDTVFVKAVKVLPIKLKIPNVITPNGDNINDYFIISEAPPGEDETGGGLKSAEYEGFKALNIYYKRTTLVIFNRHGRKVFESNDYQNNWDGGNLKDGTYFYMLECEGFKSTDVYKGSLTIIGSNK